MVKFTVNAPVEVDICIEEYLPHARMKSMLREIERRFGGNVHMDKSDFRQLAEYIIEMRFDAAFALMERAAPELVNARDCQNRHIAFLKGEKDDDKAGRKDIGKKQETIQ